LAVAGEPENRVGVVVAKNDLAKKYGVKTTDTVWQAQRKCPDLVFVPPRHHLYKKISNRINDIYHEYTEYVEPASIDESYLDMTGAPKLYGLSDRELADMLRDRIRTEIGITISVGVSYNKIFAKMGSDYKKPDATTEITPENYRDILWPLPVSDLMFAGKAAVSILNKKSIQTIGDLACQPKERLRDLLGKGGDQLWIYANGLDTEPVRKWGDAPEIKSVSRGMTFKRDLITEEEVKTGVAVLVDHVAMTLRRHALKGAVVNVQIKTPDLRSISRQTSLDHHTYLQHEIQEVAMQLIRDNWFIGEKAPIRAITVGVTKLLPADQAGDQIDMFDLLGASNPAKPGTAQREKQEKLEAAVDIIRKRFGSSTITLGYQQNEEIGVSRERRRDD
jgi:DNA polymerase-4